MTRPRSINGNGREEVIVVTGGASPTSGLVSIWEHSGAVGENLYSRIFEYTTVSYVFSAAIGDSDNDNRPEIVLGLGGFGGFPINVRRIEYDPGLGTWVHTLFESDVIGLPTAPHVADLDEDGEEELACGSSGFVTIFENTAENSYTHRFTTGEPLGGNIMSVASRQLSVPGSMSFTAGSFDGDLAVWSYDSVAESWEQTYGALPVGGAIRGLAMADDGEDGFEEILTGISSADQVRVLRRVPIATDVATGAPPGVTTLGLIKVHSGTLATTPGERCRAGSTGYEAMERQRAFRSS